MSTLIEGTHLTVEPHDSFVSFERDRPTGWANRYLAFKGQRAYHIGYWCDTCQFAFAQIDGAAGWASPSEVSSRLNEGVSRLDEDLVRSAAQLLPGGEYRVSLFELMPIRVSVGASRDYFSNEQTRLWEREGLPHWPGTEYYRIPPENVATAEFPTDRLFEFVVPMYQGAYPRALSAYVKRLEAGGRPTALAVSVLDIKTADSKPDAKFMDWLKSPPLRPLWAAETHICLTHYLLDGHNKVFAASLLARPITLLSFLTLDHSFATKDWIDRTIASLPR